MQCQLCQRELDKLTVHHLVPRQTVKRKQAEVGETIDICSACHRQIHSLFTNQALAKNLNTIDKLRSEPKMEKFLAWVKKQKPDKKIRVYRNK
jgi:3-methyladenine DNA glycosylase AlkC